MTTLPDRLLKIEKPIKYILQQSSPLNVLYLNIPLKTLRGKTYDIPKNFLQQFDGYHTKVIINRCKKDYGPITKLAPTIELETEPNTYILTFDDDIIVHRHLVRKLKEKIQKYPNICVGFSGVCIGTFPFYFQFVIDNKIDSYVDWIQGVHVVAYKRSFFTTISDLVTFGDNTPIKKELLFNDDHRVSAYLAFKNIDRLSIGCNIQKYLFKHEEGQSDALSARHSKLFREHYKIIKYFSENGLYHHSYRLTRSLIFFLIVISSISVIIFLGSRNINIYIRFIITILSTVIVINYFKTSLALKKYL